MRDTIYRDDAIRVASGFCHPANVAKELAKLPSAQPEVIRCKDCKYSEADDKLLLCHYYGDQWNEENHWCSHAKLN